MVSSIALMGGGKSAPSSGGGGGGSFTASTYGTVVGWWDFSDTTKALNNTGASAANTEAVQTITDKGPNAYNGTQSTSGKRPVMATNVQNGLQAINCDGTRWFELTSAKPAMKNRTGYTVCAVCTQHSSAGMRVCEFEDGSGGQRMNVGMLSDRQWFLEGNIADGSSVYQLFSGGGTVATLDAWYIMFWIVDTSGGTGKIYANGSVKKASASLGTSGTIANTNSLENPVLLANSLYDSTMWNGYMGEIIIWDGAMNDTNRDNAETALGTKWGITVV